MKKKRMLLRTLYAILISVIINTENARGQAAGSYVIGTSAHNEVGTVVRLLSDGSSIIGGYMHDINTGTTATGVGMIYMKVLNGTIVWAKKIDADGVDKFIQDIIQTSNGDLVIVTSELNTSLHIYIAGIYRVDVATGNILYQNRFDVGTGGSYFSSVCETYHGNIIAVGSYNGNSQGLVVNYSPNLVPYHHDIIDYYHFSTPTIFTGVVATQDNNSWSSEIVTICGALSRGTTMEAALFRYSLTNPLGTSGIFTMIKTFDLKDGAMTNSKFNKIFYGYKDPTTPTQYSDRIILSGSIYNGTQSEQFTLQSDVLGDNAKANVLNNSNTYTNTSKIFPYDYWSSTDQFYVYSIENPGTTTSDPVFAGDLSILDGRLSGISSLKNSGTIDFSSNSLFSPSTPHSFLDINGNMVLYPGTGGSFSFSIYLPTYNVVGAMKDPVNGIGGTDIYFSDFIPSSMTGTPCTYVSKPLSISNITYDTAIVTLGNAKPNFVDTLSPVTADDISLSINLLCGPRPTPPPPPPPSNPCGATLSITSSYVGKDSPGTNGCLYTLSASVTLTPGWYLSSYFWRTGTFPSSFGAWPYGSGSHTWSVVVPAGMATTVSGAVEIHGPAIGNYIQGCFLDTTITLNCQENGHPKILSINEITGETESLNIYPNPSQGDFTISTTNMNIDNIAVINILGQRLAEYHYKNRTEVHISLKQFVTGTYFIKINDNITRVVNKID